MADIFEKLIYQPVRTARVGGVPSIDYAANKEAIRSQATTADALTRIASFAFESAKGKQEIMGTERGVSAPTQTLQSLAGKDRSSFSFEEEAAYTAASKALSIELGIKAKKAMGEIVLEATNRGADSATLQDALDSVIEGYGGSIDLLDPVAGKEFRLSLEDSRNSLYLNYSEKELQKAKQEQKHKTLIAADESLSEIQSLAHDSYQDWDSTISRLITNYDGILEAGGLSPSERTAKVLEAKKFAHVSRIEGEYSRQKTLADKRDYLEAFKKDIPRSTDKGISRGLLDNEAQVVLRSLSQEYNLEVKALNAQVDSVQIKMRDELTNIVNSGGVVSKEKIADIKLSIDELEEAGVDIEAINKLKINLQSTEDNLDYLRKIKKYNIVELEDEINSLTKQWNANANPIIGFKLKQVGAEFNMKAAELQKKKAKLKPQIDKIQNTINQVQEIIDNNETVDPNFLETIDISMMYLMEDPDYIPGALDEVKTNLAELRSFIEFRNDIKDDSSTQIEAKLIEVEKRLEASTGVRSGYYNLKETTKLLKLQKDLEKRASAVRAGIKNDPLLFANDSGLITLEPTLTDKLFGEVSSDDQILEIKTSVGKRVNSAQKSANHYGHTVKYLTNNEVDTISQVLSSPDTSSLIQGHILGNIAKYFGENSREVFRQISEKKDANTFMYIGGMIANGSSQDVTMKALVGRKISEGMKDTVLGEFEDKAALRQKILSNLNLEDSMVGVVDNIKKVGGYIYLASEKSSTTTIDSELYEDALQLAAGRRGSGTQTAGGIVEWNGRQVILPSNIYHQDGLDLFFNSIKKIQDLEKYSVSWDKEKGMYTRQGHLPIGVLNGEVVSLNEINNAQLITVQDGLYKLRTKDGTLFTEAGVPFLLDLKLVGTQK